jgi:hypothetical protein
MVKGTVYVVGAAGLALVAALLGRHWYIQRQAVWQDRLADAVEARKAADQTARAAERGIAVEKRRVLQLAAQVERLERRKIPVRVVRDSVVPLLPDTCQSAVAPLVEQIAIRDSLLELKDSNLASFDRVNVYVGQQLVAARVRVAELEHVVRRPTRKWYVPRIGAGMAAGIDVTGRPNAVAGLTLGWSF